MLLKIGLVILALATYSQGVEFQDLSRWTSGSCPSRDNCHLMGNLSFEERNCECDPHCSTFQDCCVDAPYFQPESTSSSITCMPYGKNFSLGAYVLDYCPTDYAGPKSVKDFCEGQDDFHDLFSSTPVTDILTNVTFRNGYCAECNSVREPYLKSWLLSMMFKNLSTSNLSEEFVWRHFNFYSSERKWGLRNATNFYPLIFTFYKPDYISYVRQCRPNLISSCPPDWNKIQVKRACGMYTSIVHAFEKSYRNIQCAVCNGEKVAGLSCTKRPGNTKIQDDLPDTFEMIVDFNSSKSIIKEKIHKIATPEWS
ncbi:SMB domain-containing protein [Trichonephila clavata]|uniref:SMB domain-containing protein n=1 Tax=Trichonephila clavata TaxID=2740835 RepID=A0A8X6GX49_TRICU|nr:SMB domain-containing protein [Trichonephila clavata]